MEWSEFRVPKINSRQNRWHNRLENKEREVRKGAGLNWSWHQKAQQTLRFYRLMMKRKVILNNFFFLNFNFIFYQLSPQFNNFVCIMIKRWDNNWEIFNIRNKNKYAKKKYKAGTIRLWLLSIRLRNFFSLSLG